MSPFVLPLIFAQAIPIPIPVIPPPAVSRPSPGIVNPDPRDHTTTRTPDDQCLPACSSLTWQIR